MNSHLYRACQLVFDEVDNTVAVDEMRLIADQISSLDISELNQLLEQLSGQIIAKSPQKSAMRLLLSLMCARYEPSIESRDELKTDPIVCLYETLDASDSARGYLLNLLAVEQSSESVSTLANILATNPPESSQQIVPSISILMRRPGPNILKLFPKVLNGLQFRAVAGPILDLANFLFRTGRVSRHPASARAGELTELLGIFAGILGKHEDDIQRDENPTPESALAVADSISVVVSLCDALALMEAREAIGKLYQVLDLSHRRLRTEAAAALARMGEEDGKTALVELAQYPVTRLRVLAYADELGCCDRIADEFKSSGGRAEAELTLLLSQPTHFGFAPASCELIDRRIQYWPGYDEPIECFLFRYTYQFEQGELENVGIVGPLTHCISANLNHLPAEQVYAAYAGWHVDHDDILTVELDNEIAAQRVETEKRIRHIASAGFESIIPVFIGSLFGDRSLVAKARKEQLVGSVVATQTEIEWFEGLDPETSFSTYVGQRLLRSFNEAQD